MRRRASDSCVIAVDIGGTDTKLGRVVGTPPELEQTTSFPTQQETVEEYLSLLEAGISKLIPAGTTVSGIGVCVPGFLNEERSVLVYGPNVRHLTGFPLKERLQERFKTPATLDVDVNAAALAEYLLGAGRGSSRFLCIMVGTGIGGGVVLDGQLLRFTAHCAGDVGHVIIDPEGPRCTAGCRGCAEAFASAYAIARSANEMVSRQEAGAALARIGAKRPVTAADVIELAQKGDETALQITRKAGWALGVALASLVNIFNPDRIAVAGGVTEAGDALFQAMSESFKATAASFFLTEIQRAVLGHTAPLLGAALLCIRNVDEWSRQPSNVF